MIRVKDFQATGLAPLGKLYAGDLNAIQDAAAALSDFTQTLSLGTLRVGAADLQLLRYGAGAGTVTSEARLSADMRIDGILRPLGGLIPPAFTTTQRDAIPANMAPYGLKILNTTTNREEWNSGTDGARVWRPIALNGAGTLVFPDATVQSSAAIIPEVDMGLLTALGG